MESLSISFRPAVESDMRYVKNSWLRSFRRGDGVHATRDEDYYNYEEKRLRFIISRASNSGGMLLAYETLPPDATWHDAVEAPILGYICAEAVVDPDGLLIHYVYVRGHEERGKKYGKQYRRMGIARALVAEAQRRLDVVGMPMSYTYRPPICWVQGGIAHVVNGMDYVPWLKETTLPNNWETGQAPS